MENLYDVAKYFFGIGWQARKDAAQPTAFLCAGLASCQIQEASFIGAYSSLVKAIKVASHYRHETNRSENGKRITKERIAKQIGKRPNVFLNRNNECLTAVIPCRQEKGPYIFASALDTLNTIDGRNRYWSE